jgi:hypothetical protein
VLNGSSIRTLVESVGTTEASNRLVGLLKSKEVRPEDFSLRELAETFCGHEWYRQLNPRNFASPTVSLTEAGDAVDVTAFGNITGQFLYSKIHEGWNAAGFIGDDLFQTVPTQFDGEKIPGIGRIPSEGESIHPGMPYPEAGLGEHYFQTPSTNKHGMIVSVTKEAIFFDRTGLLAQRAQAVGERLRVNKEKRQLATFAGVTITIGNETFNGNNHVWRGTTYNTYSTSANAIGINAKASSPLTDWTSVEQALLLFSALKDPDTNLPILIRPDTLVVMPAKLFTAKRIVSATEIRTTVPGYATSGTPQQFISGNVIDNYAILSSPLLYQILQDSGISATNAADHWYVGQRKKGFWYMENWPLTTVTAPANSIKEFEQDIVLRVKASERGVPWVADPRFNAKMYNA